MFSLVLLGNVVERVFKRRVRSFGLTSSNSALLLLAVHDDASEPQILKTYHERLNIPYGTLTGTAQGLHDQGFVLMKQDVKGDGRAKSLTLTDKGRELAPKVRASLSAIWTEVVVDKMPLGQNAALQSGVARAKDSVAAHALVEDEIHDKARSKKP